MNMIIDEDGEPTDQQAENVANAGAGTDAAKGEKRSWYYS